MSEKLLLNDIGAVQPASLHISEDGYYCINTPFEQVRMSRKAAKELAEAILRALDDE